MIELSRKRESERYAACSDEVMAHPPTRRIQNVSVALCCVAVILRAFFVKVQRQAGGGGTRKG